MISIYFGRFPNGFPWKDYCFKRRRGLFNAVYATQLQYSRCVTERLEHI
jgi:hypothetical protein